MPKYTFETKMPIAACRFCQYRVTLTYASADIIKCKIDGKRRVETIMTRPKSCPLKEVG